MAKSFVPTMMSTRSKGPVPQESSQAPDRVCMPHPR